MLHDLLTKIPWRPSAFLLTCLVAVTAPLMISAQKVTQVIIEDADLLRIDSESGRTVQKLIGNAVLRHDNTWFYCDTATLDDNNNLRAVGGIHINYGDSVHVYGDYLFYNGATRIALLDSNVRLVDDRATLYTDHMEYDRNLAIAYYNRGGRIVDEDNVLTSKTGKYLTRISEFLFKDSVVVTNPEWRMTADTLRYNTDTEVVYIEGPTYIFGKDDRIYSEKGWYDTRTDRSELSRNNEIIHLEQILRGDWIYYDRNAEYGKAVGRVWLKDTAQNIILEGRIGEFFRGERFSYLTDSARAILVEERDSLFMHADSFKLQLDSADKARLLFAYNRMKFYRSDLQGMSDSLVYRVNDSVIAMLKKPVLWSDDNQLTADSIWLHVSKNRIDSMQLFNLAFIISRDSTHSFNQIKGKQMKAYFRDNELHSIRVDGNAETVYFVRDEERLLIGINKSVSSSMIIRLLDRQINDIVYLTEPDATLYPENELKEDELFLRDFYWIEAERPWSRDHIFKWGGE
jgi:lipopolysaccharide export system protein LptA